MRATSSSWKNNPIPLKSDKLPFSAIYVDSDIEKIKYGYIPKDMEDKWFIYFDDNHLYFHRSWTGCCIFIVKFKDSHLKLEVIETLVNRDTSQYTSVDSQKDLELLITLINNMLLKA